ncbi:MAG: hypothetical protein JWN00_4386 [Actinomycetia bacterium]|nr:hypothetical protein [Actinomycetes bacterium]
MAEGLSNSGVSSHLHVGVRTVEAYINAVFTALGASTPHPNCVLCFSDTFRTERAGATGR